MRQVSLSAGTPGEAVYVGGHKNNPCSEIPSFCRQTSRTTSGLPLWSGLRLENSRSTHSLLNGPPAWRNSVYNHSSASHRSNFFFAMTPSVKKTNHLYEPFVTGSKCGAAVVLSRRYLSACCTRVGPSPDCKKYVTWRQFIPGSQVAIESMLYFRWRHIGASYLECRKHLSLTK